MDAVAEGEEGKGVGDLDGDGEGGRSEVEGVEAAAVGPDDVGDVLAVDETEEVWAGLDGRREDRGAGVVGEIEAASFVEQFEEAVFAQAKSVPSERKRVPTMRAARGRAKIVFPVWRS